MNSSNERSIAASKLSQPLKWHSNGGKHYLAPKLIELFPPHVHYVEPYFGGGSVLLSKSGEGVSNNASSKATKERKIERVWMNY